MLKIFDQSHEVVGYIKKYRDCKIESVLSTAEKTLSFTYLAKSKKIDYEYYIQTADAEYVVKAIRITSDGYPEYTAALNMEELESKTWETFLAKDSSLRDTANLALAGTGWRVAECTVDKKRSVGLQNVTSKVVLQKLCTVFMCEMQVDSKAKTVSFKEKFGEDKGVYFLRGLNLRQLTLSGDTYDFYTRIIPVGKDNLKITSVNNGKEYIDNFQYSKKIIPYVWQDTSYEDAAALMEDAAEKLKDLSIPKKSYTVDVRDLAYRSARYSILEYGLGDTITLIDRKTGVRDKQRITKITEYPGNQDKNTCDIANTRETFDEIQSRLKEAASIIEAAKNLDGSINGNAVDKVTTDQILGFKDGVESEIQNSGTISGIYGKIEATTAEIGTIKSTYLQVTEADIKYATIDLANIKNGSIKTAMIDVGAVNTAQIADGSITDAKIVELTANKITAGTLSVERLEIRGSNRSIVYALNNITGALQAQNVDTLNGEILTQRTITADKIVASSITGNEIAAKTILANHIDVIDLFAQKIEATDLHVVGNSTVDGNLIASGTISADRLDVNGIFAKDITATGTISGATLKGASGQFTGTVDAETLYVKGKIQIYASSYRAATTILEETEGDDINQLILGSQSYGSIISRNHIAAPSISTNGYGSFGGDISATRGLKLNHADTSLYLYNESGTFCIMHTGADGNSSWPIIWNFASNSLAVSNAIYCGSTGSFDKGITSKAESIFHTGSYTDPYPNKVCAIKSWGTIASLRFAAKGVSNTWLGGAKTDGAAYDTICLDDGALVPGWRIRSKDGAWVGASYALDPGFRIYYCKNDRLAGNNNATDAVYTFGTSGTFYTKALTYTSDERQKNMLSDITERYEDLFMKLEPVLFSWKSENDGIHMGFGAQTVLQQAKKCGLTESELAAVHPGKGEGAWSLGYSEFIPLTVKMTQKSLRKIADVEETVNTIREETAKIAFLQGQIEQLYSYIGELKMQISERG